MDFLSLISLALDQLALPDWVLYAHFIALACALLWNTQSDRDPQYVRMLLALPLMLLVAGWVLFIDGVMPGLLFVVKVYCYLAPVVAWAPLLIKRPLSTGEA